MPLRTNLLVPWVSRIDLWAETGSCSPDRLVDWLFLSPRESSTQADRDTSVSLVGVLSLNTCNMSVRMQKCEDMHNLWVKLCGQAVHGSHTSAESVTAVCATAAIFMSGLRIELHYHGTHLAFVLVFVGFRARLCSFPNVMSPQILYFEHVCQ